MESNTKPNFVEYEIIGGTKRFRINLNIVEVRYGWYEWDSYDIPLGKFTYEGIIDELITYKYPNDKMQAVINNYLLEPENEEYITAFSEMQSWRKEAKEIAKQALEYELH